MLKWIARRILKEELSDLERRLRDLDSTWMMMFVNTRGAEIKAARYKEELEALKAKIAESEKLTWRTI